jgi:NAD(P)-dependent dehydrogenase (short-subunit alcohol dehydrogenase family)
LIFSIFTKRITKSAECAAIGGHFAMANTGEYALRDSLRPEDWSDFIPAWRLPGWSRSGKFLVPDGSDVSKRLDGKVAVVTGVSDRGIGGAIAERLADDGAAVTILWMERPDRLIHRLERRGHSFVEARCDVKSTPSIKAAVDACMSEFGQVDILVNNAGIEDVHNFEDGTDDVWENLLDVNLLGTMRMTRSVLPYLTEPEGVIVNISSVLGMAGCTGFGAYSATKAGLIGLTQSLAAELAPRRMRCVGVAPALVFTPMMQRHLSNGDTSMEESLNQSHPLGVGAARDVASAVAFLASPEARWITGTTLPLGWMPSFPLPFGQPDTAGQASLHQSSKSPAEKISPVKLPVTDAAHAPRKKESEGTIEPVLPIADS